MYNIDAQRYQVAHRTTKNQKHTDLAMNATELKAESNVKKHSCHESHKTALSHCGVSCTSLK